MSDTDRTSGYLRPDLETMDPQARKEYLDGRVAAIVAHAYANAPAWRALMDQAGAEPGDLTTVESLYQLPITEKAELVAKQRQSPPFGGLSALPYSDMRRIYASPGPIFEPSEKEVEDDRWAQAFYAAGFRSGDKAQVTFNFNMVPFAFALDDALNLMGCLSIPTGVGNSETQVQILADLKVEAYIGTPSFLAALADRAEAMGLDPLNDLNLKVAFVAAEMLPESLRAELQGRLGMLVRQSYGTAEAGCLSYECYHLGGMHYASDCVVEVVDPDGGQPVGEGEPGEVVCTIFNQAYPLIRFGTGDLSSFVSQTCECGRTAPKLTRILGRVDQVTKVKGMFVHPGGVGQVAAKFPQICAFQLVVTRSGNFDEMTLVCELAEESADPEALAEEVKASMREILRLKGEVEFVAKGSLPEDRKVVDDRRTWD